MERDSCSLLLQNIATSLRTGGPCVISASRLAGVTKPASSAGRRRLLLPFFLFNVFIGSH